MGIARNILKFFQRSYSIYCNKNRFGWFLGEIVCVGFGLVLPLVEGMMLSRYDAIHGAWFECCR